MSNKRNISLREFSKEFGFKSERMGEVYSLPIAVKASGDIKALYYYDLMVVIYRQYINLHIKPALTEKLADTGLVFSRCEMDESEIKRMIAESKSSGDKQLYDDVVKVIYKDSDRIAQEYNLLGKAHFAKAVEEKAGVHKMSALHRVNKVIEEYELKPVAYTKKLTPVFDADELSAAYDQWVKHAKAKYKSRMV